MFVSIFVQFNGTNIIPNLLTKTLGWGSNKYVANVKDISSEKEKKDRVKLHLIVTTKLFSPPPPQSFCWWGKCIDVLKCLLF